MEFAPFDEKIWISTPTMHETELKYVIDAFDKNWMSTVGANIDTIENLIAKKVGTKYALALACGTDALHLAVKLAGVKPGDRVFCSDMTFIATVNPVVYEGGIPVFIDTERDTWNMDPQALRKAFELYPDVKAVVVANLYGTPAKLDEIREICDEHHAFLIEDAAESLGATLDGRQTGSFGHYNAISFNGNKIITGTTGGMLLTNEKESAAHARKMSTQARDSAAWYQHSEIGYNYRMSNVVAGIVRGQLCYLEEHIEKKKEIYFRYKEGLQGLGITMNPYALNSSPNFWLSCLLIDRDHMCEQIRSDYSAVYRTSSGKSCPTEILETLARCNVESRPIWKPMHLQPYYKDNIFVSVSPEEDVGADIFERGLCLPSDIKMTPEQQNRIIEIIRSCFE